MRPTEFGIAIGTLPAGPANAITDVHGVRVGHRPGVTAIVPDALAAQFRQPMSAGVAVLNGAGELTGSLSIAEWGTLETPVLLTATMSVGTAYQAVVEAMLAADAAVADDVVIPVVGECDDSWLIDPSVPRVTVASCREAIEAASVDCAAGCVGAGEGMLCLGWKGGIGTASRRVGTHTVGVLVLTNFGSLERLTVDGVAAGRAFVAAGRRGYREAPEGSCIVVIATDAPLLPAQCQRLARRAGLGLARTGSVGTHGSGEIFLAFSTTCRFDRGRDAPVTFDVLGDGQLDPLFTAVVDATEEAVLDSLMRATTTTGRFGRVAEALPLDALRTILGEKS